jgi:CHAT domain-containing protein
MDPLAGLRQNTSDEDVIAVFRVLGDGDFKLVRSVGDEPVSLSAAFLAAGAGSVLCSNWPVDDTATALFMILFYTRLESCDAVAALSVAQQELRSLTAAKACELWNRHTAHTRDVETLDVRKLGELMCMDLSECDKPFQSPYFWAAFSLWGRANPPISR